MTYMYLMVLICHIFTEFKWWSYVDAVKFEWIAIKKTFFNTTPKNTEKNTLKTCILCAHTCTHKYKKKHIKTHFFDTILHTVRMMYYYHYDTYMPPVVAAIPKKKLLLFSIAIPSIEMMIFGAKIRIMRCTIERCCNYHCEWAVLPIKVVAL